MIRLPDSTQRHVIIGRTGSGKSIIGAWALSLRNFDQMPWVMVDPKYDDMLNSLGAEEIMPTDKPPRKPGLYIMHPIPGHDDNDLDNFLSISMQRAVTEGQGIGFLFDEGYSVPKNSKAFVRILTQGRSKHVPCIILAQRPVHLNRFVWSEADFIQYIYLTHDDDIGTVNRWMPGDIWKKLPDYWSRYYDVAKNRMTVLKPVPHPDVIRDAIRQKMSGGKSAIVRI